MINKRAWAFPRNIEIEGVPPKTHRAIEVSMVSSVAKVRFARLH